MNVDTLRDDEAWLALREVLIRHDAWDNEVAQAVVSFEQGVRRRLWRELPRA